MVIPYMPMLVPPVNWTGYGYFSFVLLLSYEIIYYLVLFNQDMDYAFRQLLPFDSMEFVHVYFLNEKFIMTAK